MYGKSKIENEDPISVFFYKISYEITKKIKINPNIITSLRLFLIFFVYYSIHFSQYKLIGGIIFILCYFLDHLDGEMARQHDLVTRFGDYYDHIVDHLYNLPVFLLLYLKFKNSKYLLYLLLLFVTLLSTSSLLISCQEKGFDNKIKSESLTSLSKLCFIKDLSILRLFGLGLFHIYLFILIII